MRLDLGFQGIQLRLPLPDLRHIHPADIGLQLLGHVVQPLGQMPQLIFPFHLDAHAEVPLLDLVHPLLQLPYRPPETAQEMPVEQEQDDEAASHEKEHHLPCLV